MINDFISIGKITSTFGLKGSLKVASSGDILSSLKPNSIVYLLFEEEFKPFKLLSLRQDKKKFIVSIEGFGSIEESEKVISKILYFPKTATESLLTKDEYFVHQLIGLHPCCNEIVYKEYTLLEVLENPVHPILRFSDNTTEVLIPYINQFVGKVDTQNQKIEILNWEDWLLAD